MAKTNHKEDKRSKATQDIEELAQLEKESREQKLPEQKVVFKADSIKSRAGRRGVHNLPDQTNPPMGFDEEKAFDSVFPFLKLPYLQPSTQEDVISFGSPDAGGFLDAKNKKIPLNSIFFGDNLHILRAFPSNCIDLIYIDPPFFSGRNYNQIWGDDNEVRAFHDIWEDGLPSYLVWLNARLWEMRRVLKSTGSIYVHCDWHASHYIKCEMDKIFGYDNFKNEIIWYYQSGGGRAKDHFNKKHDVLLWYSKSQNCKYNIDKIRVSYKETSMYSIYGTTADSGKKYKPDREKGKNPDDVWEMNILNPTAYERIGYPTQKPLEVIQRIIDAHSEPNDIVADFFMGGGTFLAGAIGQRTIIGAPLSGTQYCFTEPRRFIGCDISRVACSVTLNRLIKIAEEVSGRTASVNLDKPKKDKQMSFEMTIKKIPDIRVYYMGVYPIEKFEFISQKEFEDFILTCYEARRFTGEGEITGVMNAATTILIGSVKPNEALSEGQLKKFVEDILKLRYQENIRMKLKVIAWVFPPSLQRYAKILENYFFKKNLPVEIELIPINSQLFRRRILEHYQDTSKSEFLLKFISQASVMDIAYKKISGLKYKFEVVGARSNNIDGYLINCQWDFNFMGGRFGESEYALMREQKEGKYVAVLKAEKEFDRPGKYIIACRVQDNLGGEAVKIKEIDIK